MRLLTLFKRVDSWPVFRVYPAFEADVVPSEGCIPHEIDIFLPFYDLFTKIAFIDCTHGVMIHPPNL